MPDSTYAHPGFSACGELRKGSLTAPLPQLTAWSYGAAASHTTTFPYPVMSYDMAFDEPWRAPRFVESNPLGLDDSDAQSVAQRLDIIQCTFWVLYHQYQKHHWLVEGPQFRDLHLFLEESYDQIYEDVDVVAERITALGAIPSTRPSTHETKSVVPSEPEGAYRIADSLRHDLRAEQILASDLRDVIELAIEKRDYGTKHMLEGMLAAGEDRAHHLDHFLGDDSLS